MGTETIYTVQIRTRAGEVIAEGETRPGEEINHAVVRLYKRARGLHDNYLRARSDTYFRTDAGYPIGTHHMDLGRGSSVFNVERSVVVAVHSA